MKLNAMLKRLVCWLVGHDWYYGADFTEPVSAWVRYCGRCGLMESVNRRAKPKGESK